MDYVQRWAAISRPARWYLLHVALQTASLAMIGLFFNLAIGAFGYERSFLGLLDTVSIGVAAALSVPLWWLASRIGPRLGLLLGALVQTSCVAIYGLSATPTALLIAAGLSGAAAVVYEVSAAPFMMRTSDAATRDTLFSTSAALAVGVAGISTLLAGSLPGLLATLLGVEAESAGAYQATFRVAAAGLVVALVPLLLVGTNADRPPQPAQPQQDGEPAPLPFATIRRQPWAIGRLLVSPFLISWGAAMLVRYLNLFFKERFGVSDGELGLIFAALNIGIGAASLAAPLVSARLGTIRTVVLVQALSIPFLLVLGFVSFTGVAVAAAVIRGMLFNMATPLYQAFAMAQTEERSRPLVVGLISGASTGGYLVGPLISTSIQQQYGFAPLFVITTICYGLAALANYLLFVRKKTERVA